VGNQVFDRTTRRRNEFPQQARRKGRHHHESLLAWSLRGERRKVRGGSMMSTWIHVYVPGKPGYVFSSSVPGRGLDAISTAIGKPKPGKANKPRVLVVDDEKIIADSVAMILNHSGFDAIAHYGGTSAMIYIQQECPDILLSDVMMPDTNGIQLAKATEHHCPGTRIVLISGNAATPNLLDHAFRDGSPFELLAKPIHPSQLIHILKG
jgi:CheY-like chemotaxis protein